jgi:hypothetical protein
MSPYPTCTYNENDKTIDPYHSEIILKQAYNPIWYKKNNNRKDTKLSITNNKLKSLFVLPHTPEPNYTEINLKQANPIWTP